ncbi:DNA primase [archaeon]|jgi:DNA primase|nr:DNA primase [archaeon]MBT3451093.1 DNA primase [archaeon]MBT6868663.1 DNA primase [archaeon]MBT7193370.1 DNA primase [archaeon]MBT7381460.1 DNA primase [archaeon]
MAKISPVAAKYIVHTKIKIDGIVDRPDVIGAIFGQTEGLLGNDLELRELQRSGKIGRIEVNLGTTSGKTTGDIVIPSSLDKTETAIIAAALEIIQRIGPCNSKLNVEKIEDVRISKRQFVVERAKALLHDLTENTLPDSQEISDEVSQSVRMMEVKDYGKDRLPAGPAIKENEEIIVVEGRADVLNMLKHGFKNAISMNGSSVPKTIIELAKTKGVIVFVDGDRGGDLNIRELVSVADIDFVCKAPDGKEVEELTKKEIHKALRGKITAEQAKLDLGITEDGELINKDAKLVKPMIKKDNSSYQRNNNRNQQKDFRRKVPENQQTRTPNTANNSHSKEPISKEEKKKLKEIMEELFGTRGACIFDEKLNVLGKVPISELNSTIKSLKTGIYALALDGTIDIELVRLSEKLNIKYLVATSSKTKGTARVKVLTEAQISS